MSEVLQLLLDRQVTAAQVIQWLHGRDDDQIPTVLVELQHSKGEFVPVFLNLLRDQANSFLVSTESNCRHTPNKQLRGSFPLSSVKYISPRKAPLLPVFGGRSAGGKLNFTIPARAKNLSFKDKIASIAEIKSKIINQDVAAAPYDLERLLQQDTCLTSMSRSQKVYPKSKQISPIIHHAGIGIPNSDIGSDNCAHDGKLSEAASSGCFTPMFVKTKSRLSSSTPRLAASTPKGSEASATQEYQEEVMYNNRPANWNRRQSTESESTVDSYSGGRSGNNNASNNFINSYNLNNSGVKYSDQRNSLQDYFVVKKLPNKKKSNTSGGAGKNSSNNDVNSFNSSNQTNFWENRSSRGSLNLSDNGSFPPIVTQNIAPKVDKSNNKKKRIKPTRVTSAPVVDSMSKYSDGSSSKNTRQQHQLEGNSAFINSKDSDNKSLEQERKMLRQMKAKLEKRSVLTKNITENEPCNTSKSDMSSTTVPQYNKEKLFANEEQPLTNKEQPTTNKEQPTTNKEQPTVTKEQLTATKEQPTATKEQPTANKEQLIAQNEQLITHKEEPIVHKEHLVTNEEQQSYSKQIDVAGLVAVPQDCSLTMNVSSPQLSTNMETLDELIRVYSYLVVYNYVPSLMMELYFAFQLLTVRGCFVKPRHYNNVPGVPYFFSSIHNCVYFASHFLASIPDILRLLDRATLRLLSENDRLQQFTPEAQQLISNLVDTRPPQPSPKQTPRSPMKGVAFQVDSDNRANFPDNTTFHIFRKQRDLFYELLREWEREHQMSHWNLSTSLGPKIRSLLELGPDPCNVAHLARLFVSQLLSMCEANHMIPLPQEDGGSVLSLLKRQHPEKFQRLQQRLVAPSRVTGGPVPPPSFPGVQQFFRGFLLEAYNPTFNTHLEDNLVPRLLDLLGAAEGDTPAPRARSRVSVRLLLRQVGVIGKFVGLLWFSSYHSPLSLPQPAIAAQVALRSKINLRMSLCGVVRCCATRGQLVAAVVCCVQLLSVADSVALHTTHLHTAAMVLRHIYYMLITCKSAAGSCSHQSKAQSTCLNDNKEQHLNAHGKCDAGGTGYQQSVRGSQQCSAKTCPRNTTNDNASVGEAEKGIGETLSNRNVDDNEDVTSKAEHCAVTYDDKNSTHDAGFCRKPRSLDFNSDKAVIAKTPAGFNINTTSNKLGLFLTDGTKSNSDDNEKLGVTPIYKGSCNAESNNVENTDASTFSTVEPITDHNIVGNKISGTNSKVTITSLDSKETESSVHDTSDAMMISFSMPSSAESRNTNTADSAIMKDCILPNFDVHDNDNTTAKIIASGNTSNKNYGTCSKHNVTSNPGKSKAATSVGSEGVASTTCGVNVGSAFTTNSGGTYNSSCQTPTHDPVSLTTTKFEQLHPLNYANTGTAFTTSAGEACSSSRQTASHNPIAAAATKFGAGLQRLNSVYSSTTASSSSTAATVFSAAIEDNRRSNMLSKTVFSAEVSLFLRLLLGWLFDLPIFPDGLFYADLHTTDIDVEEYNKTIECVESLYSAPCISCMEEAIRQSVPERHQHQQKGAAKHGSSSDSDASTPSKDASQSTVRSVRAHRITPASADTEADAAHASTTADDSAAADVAATTAATSTNQAATTTTAAVATDQIDDEDCRREQRAVQSLYETPAKTPRRAAQISNTFNNATTAQSRLETPVGISQDKHEVQHLAASSSQKPSILTTSTSQSSETSPYTPSSKLLCVNVTLSEMGSLQLCSVSSCLCCHLTECTSCCSGRDSNVLDVSSQDTSIINQSTSQSNQNRSISIRSASKSIQNASKSIQNASESNQKASQSNQNPSQSNQDTSISNQNTSTFNQKSSISNQNTSISNRRASQSNQNVSQTNQNPSLSKENIDAGAASIIVPCTPRAKNNKNIHQNKSQFTPYRNTQDKISFTEGDTVPYTPHGKNIVPLDSTTQSLTTPQNKVILPSFATNSRAGGEASQVSDNSRQECSGSASCPCCCSSSTSCTPFKTPANLQKHGHLNPAIPIITFQETPEHNNAEDFAVGGAGLRKMLMLDNRNNLGHGPGSPAVPSNRLDDYLTVDYQLLQEWCPQISELKALLTSYSSVGGACSCNSCCCPCGSNTGCASSSYGGGAVRKMAPLTTVPVTGVKNISSGHTALVSDGGTASAPDAATTDVKPPAESKNVSVVTVSATSASLQLVKQEDDAHRDLQNQLEESFFHHQPSSVRECVLFIVEQLVSNCVRHLRSTIIPTATARYVQKLQYGLEEHIGSISTLQLLSDGLERHARAEVLSATQQLRADVSTSCLDHLQQQLLQQKQVLQTLLPTDTTNQGMLVCCGVVQRACSSRVQQWLSSNLEQATPPQLLSPTAAKIIRATLRNMNKSAPSDLNLTTNTSFEVQQQNLETSNQSKTTAATTVATEAHQPARATVTDAVNTCARNEAPDAAIINKSHFAVIAAEKIFSIVKDDNKVSTEVRCSTVKQSGEDILVDGKGSHSNVSRFSSETNNISGKEASAPINNNRSNKNRERSVSSPGRDATIDPNPVVESCNVANDSNTLTPAGNTTASGTNTTHSSYFKDESAPKTSNPDPNTATLDARMSNRKKTKESNIDLSSIENKTTLIDNISANVDPRTIKMDTKTNTLCSGTSECKINDSRALKEHSAKAGGPNHVSTAPAPSVLLAELKHIVRAIYISMKNESSNIRVTCSIPLQYCGPSQRPRDWQNKARDAKTTAKKASKPKPHTSGHQDVSGSSTQRNDTDSATSVEVSCVVSRNVVGEGISYDVNKDSDGENNGKLNIDESVPTVDNDQKSQSVSISRDEENKKMTTKSVSALNKDYKTGGRDCGGEADGVFRERRHGLPVYVLTSEHLLTMARAVDDCVKYRGDLTSPVLKGLKALTVDIVVMLGCLENPLVTHEVLESYLSLWKEGGVLELPPTLSTTILSPRILTLIEHRVLQGFVSGKRCCNGLQSLLRRCVDATLLQKELLQDQAVALLQHCWTQDILSGLSTVLESLCTEQDQDSVLSWMPWICQEMENFEDVE
uniref:Codanin-1-like isoform X1 n=1 Tax=Hirondellea gigas TaxID=1518452 RepID=A0A6A7FUP4_9CRUS